MHNECNIGWQSRWIVGKMNELKKGRGKSFNFLFTLSLLCFPAIYSTQADFFPLEAKVEKKLEFGTLKIFLFKGRNFFLRQTRKAVKGIVTQKIK